jgi:hypothetical protein
LFLFHSGNLSCELARIGPLSLGGAAPLCEERSDEAISQSPADGDCFASLAMTVVTDGVWAS